jgi:hypothetical protein
VCLLNPVFAEFLYNLENISLSSHDCIFVDNLMESMCGAFDSERSRMEKFFELFEQYTGWKLLVIKYDKSETDGSLHYSNGALYCNLEVKVEKGSGGGDPYMQGIAYYIKSLPENADGTQYPCFLLELYGTAFSVNGIVNTDSQVICDTLSPTYQLLHNQDFVTSVRIARLFASLRKALGSLEQNVFSSTSRFPFISSFVDKTSDIKYYFEYQERLKGLLFSAKILNSHTEIIVKFCTRYNAEVHMHCHSCGLAPALLSIQGLGNYIVVIMEKLDLRPLVRGDAKDAGIQSQARFIFETLQEKNYVHGDMRESNVLINRSTNRLVLVDFDWAGIHGVDLYPPFMNPDINWPDGASTGKPLLHDHDSSWLNSFFQ